jgi:hypothetical protein
LTSKLPSYKRFEVMHGGGGGGGEHAAVSVMASMRIHPHDDDVAAKAIVVVVVDAVKVTEETGHCRFHVLSSPCVMEPTALPLTDTVAVDEVPPVEHDE